MRTSDVDDSAGAFAGAVTLAAALIVSPAGAPELMPKPAVIPATAARATVPAVLGIAISEVFDEPGLAALEACTLGDEPVLPPVQPATIVPARNTPTKTKRR